MRELTTKEVMVVTGGAVQSAGGGSGETQDNTGTHWQVIGGVLVVGGVAVGAAATGPVLAAIGVGAAAGGAALGSLGALHDYYSSMS